MIITRTPFRVSLFGGGTDYGAWYQENGGLVLTTAMKHYAYISVRHLPPFFEHKTRVVYSIVERVVANREIKHPSIRHCLEYLGFHDQGLEIHYDGDLPARSGIGSSSSFTVGMLHALHALRYEMVSKSQLAKEAIHVEQDLIGESVGIQDQIIAAHGGMQIIEAGPGDAYTVRPLILKPDYLHEFEKYVMLGYSGIGRTASDHAKEQISNIKSGQNTAALREMHSITSEAISMFSSMADFGEIGKLLRSSWDLKRSLSEVVSTPTIDPLFDRAYKAGALGGKLMGAGGGGFILLLVPPYKHAAIREALRENNVWVSFSVDFMGSQVFLYGNADAVDARKAPSVLAPTL